MSRIAFDNSYRYNFTSIMREFVSLGFVWSKDITQEDKENGVIGYFVKDWS